MNTAELEAHDKRFKQLADDILDKYRKGYRLTTHSQGRTTAVDTNNAETTIKQPFEEAEDLPLVLTADDIITRTEKDGETIAYEVVNDGKLLFSTVSRPLAQSFLIGWNAGQGKSAAKSASADASADKSKANNEKTSSVNPAEISASSKGDSDKSNEPPKDTSANGDKASSQSRKRMML